MKSIGRDPSDRHGRNPKMGRGEGWASTNHIHGGP